MEAVEERTISFHTRGKNEGLISSRIKREGPVGSSICEWNSEPYLSKNKN